MPADHLTQTFADGEAIFLDYDLWATDRKFILTTADALESDVATVTMNRQEVRDLIIALQRWLDAV